MASGACGVQGGGTGQCPGATNGAGMPEGLQPEIMVATKEEGLGLATVDCGGIGLAEGGRLQGSGWFGHK
jgi:hypothetical protein